MNELDRIKKVINEQLGVDKNSISRATSFVDDLGADSLDIVELVMGFETEFDIEIPEEIVETMTTVGDVVDFAKDNL